MIHRDPQPNRQLWPTILGGVLLFVALGVAGRWDAEMAEADFQHYCNMLESGAWPDFDNKQEECDAQNSEPVG